MKTVIIWSCLCFVAYFGSDIIERGMVLNSLTPWPILGTLMWVALLWFVVYWFVWPVFRFWQLKNGCVRGLNETKKVALKAKADALIMQHCKAAGLAVVFSRNNLLDGLLMLIIQARMIVEIARLVGYKPSPVFNTLCGYWIVTNSLLAALFAQDSAEGVQDLFVSVVGDMVTEPEELASDALGTLTCAYTVGTLLEGITCGATVYVTGHLFLRQLNLEKSYPSSCRLKELVSLRRAGRKEIGQELLKALPQMTKTAATKSVKLIGNMLRHMVVNQTGIGGTVVSCLKSVRGVVSRLNPLS